MFPDRDQNEIYAYLEAHHDNAARVEIVAEELSRTEDVDDGCQMKVTNNPSADDGAFNPAQRYYADLETLTAIFPNCDPNYIAERLIAEMNDPDRLQKLSSEMFDDRSYPKLKERLEQERTEAMRQRLMKPVLDIREFFAKMFPNPDEHFGDDIRPVTALYEKLALIQLSNDFRSLKIDFIRSKFEKHRNHYAPTFLDLNKTYKFLKGGHFCCCCTLAFTILLLS